MVIDIVLLSIAFIALVIATLTDIKTREVPDWVNFGLIGTGFGINLIFSIVYWESSFILNSLIGFGIFFAFAWIMFCFARFCNHCGRGMSQSDVSKVKCALSVPEADRDDDTLKSSIRPHILLVLVVLLDSFFRFICKKRRPISDNTEIPVISGSNRC